MRDIIHLFFTVLIIGAAGGIVYTISKNPQGVIAIGQAADSALRTSYATELGQVQ
jgi:hypothetical protein